MMNGPTSRSQTLIIITVLLLSGFSLARSYLQLDGSSAGLTLVELLITLAVLAIALALAIPSYQSFVEKRQVTSVSEQFASFIAEAKSEAIKQNEAASVVFAPGDSGTPWSLTFTVGGNAETLDGANFPNVTLNNSPGAATMTFDPVRGLLTNTAQTETIGFESSSSKFALAVNVSPTGRVRVCSPETDKAVAGYKACPA